MAGDSKLTAKQELFCTEYLIDAERFASYIDKSGGNDSCWNWTGAKDGQGYGRFHVGISRNSSKLSHRLAYGLSTGDSPEAVCHKCDNPSCCNPSHLFGGTRADNNRDMTSKGRHWSKTGSYTAPTGEDSPKAKLTSSDVISIREQYSEGKGTQRQLAAQYSVAQRSIANIIHRRTWADV
jgi:hypothetical protein